MTGTFDRESLRKEWADEDKAFMDLLRDTTTPKTELARAYVAASSAEELLTLASEPLCLAAAEVFFTLNSSGPLNIVASIQKHLTPNKYWSECKRTNDLFAECLLWVLEKFQEFCRHAKAYVSAEQFDQLAINASVYWYRTNRYPEQEKKAFQEQLIDAIASRAGRASAGADSLGRIMAATGRKPSHKVLAKFISLSVNHDPIIRLEPLFFVERFRQLTEGR